MFFIHDDLIIATKTTSKQKDTPLKGMEAIQNANLTLNLEKCIFGKSEIKRIEGIKPNQERLRKY